MADTKEQDVTEPVEQERTLEFQNGSTIAFTEPKKSRVELRRTPAEMLADSILRQQRIKGRKTYGRGLNHEDDYRWHMEAAQEFADGFQYVCAENLRLHDEVVRLTAELDSLRKATLDTAPFVSPMSEEGVRRSLNEHLAQHAKMAAEQGADDSQERHHEAAANSYLTPFITPMDPATLSVPAQALPPSVGVTDPPPEHHVTLATASYVEMLKGMPLPFVYGLDRSNGGEPADPPAEAP